MNEQEAYPSGRIKLFPCDICGRNFKQESLGVHRNACKKLSKPKRKVFDSGKQRAMGSDVQYVKTKETMKVQVEGVKPKEVPKSNWRQNHESFLKSLQQAKMVSQAIATGAPIPKFQPAEVPSDYINCPYCSRNFSPSAAERHIKFCETQHKRQKMSSGNNNNMIRPGGNQQKASAGRMMPPQAPPGNRKQSSEMYGGGGGYANTDYQNGYNSGNYAGRGGASGGGGGYNSGYSSGYSSSGRNQGPPPDRKPVRYDSRGMPTSNPSSGYGGGAGGGYSNSNNTNGNSLLRTGRNLSNSELNSLARNRSGSNSMKKESPVNSRRPPAQQQQAQQNGMRATYVRGPAPSNAGGGAAAAGGGFCGECGSAFPVEWAKFCSFCGDRRF